MSPWVRDAPWKKLFMVKVLFMSVAVITLPRKLKRVSFERSFFIDLKRIGLFWNSYYLESYEENKVWLQWMCDKFFSILILRLFIFDWLKSRKFSVFGHNFLAIWPLEKADIPIRGRIQPEIQFWYRQSRLTAVSGVTAVLAVFRNL